jgi:D-beta-D-heptose 7-phosphate kinase/D-beta-D-heptose 1-phosphate adenosyltransferase
LDLYYDAIIVSDYCKGFLLEEDIDEISRHNTNIFLDTKKILGEWCKNVSFIKINHVEYDRTQHTIGQLNIKNKLIITRSDEGCEFQEKIYPVEKVNIKDVSGAGDTFISGLVCEFIRTKDIVLAIKFAQNCATQVVQKKGVCTI